MSSARVGWCGRRLGGSASCARVPETEEMPGVGGAHREGALRPGPPGALPPPPRAARQVSLASGENSRPGPRWAGSAGSGWQRRGRGTERLAGPRVGESTPRGGRRIPGGSGAAGAAGAPAAGLGPALLPCGWKARPLASRGGGCKYVWGVTTSLFTEKYFPQHWARPIF